ncbi:MAG TPA: nitrite/sulfite reductase [Polyangiaceae bacterium]|jgi:sulfite reductase (ferredoxin)|nr:nitrite/sulfite reductase [Polyangiaceae bacterium]
MPHDSSYKAQLAGKMTEDLAREIDIFETQIELRKKGKIEEKLFAETRLRRGVYGQRYDNGQRHDGEAERTLAFPSGELTKGPSTMWDALGMQRIKIPLGKLSAEQLDVMADLAEEYSDGILHVTTRQDIQLHFVHIEDTPDLMRRLAAVGVTTREACGNSVRNVTACSLAGVCGDAAFDVSPYAHAATWFLMGHDDTQDFGRKFKIAFSGCAEHACGATNFHDLGAIATSRVVDGKTVRGFQVVVGGGLGSVPHPAKPLEDFVPEEELLPTIQAVCRLFSRYGERENRARARLKFVIKKMGIDEFRRLAREERTKLKSDPRWTDYLAKLDVVTEKPLRPPSKLTAPGSAAFERWRKTNVVAQVQEGYVVATATLPLGDMSVKQARALSDIARRFTGDTMRATIDQNLLFRWVSEADLPELHAALVAIGLGEPGAGTITDITACPGTDTCKLGISSSRGLASELRRRLTVIQDDMAPAARALHIKTSGCFNSCGQHHVADMGFLGVSRNVGGRRVPHFQVVVGGEWERNAGSFGLAIGAIPSKNVPEMVKRLSERYVAEKKDGETFTLFIQRIGKKEVRAMVEALSEVPGYDVDRSYYSDWGDPREYSIGDMGVGECAGEVVPRVLMSLAASEREVFESQLLMDQGSHADAAERALRAMLTAARALVREKLPDIGEGTDEIVETFRAELVETKIFFDPFAGAKFAQYLYRAVKTDGESVSFESVHQRIEEAQLFVDAAYQCYERMVRGATPAA